MSSQTPSRKFALALQRHSETSLTYTVERSRLSTASLFFRPYYVAFISVAIVQPFLLLPAAYDVFLLPITLVVIGFLLWISASVFKAQHVYKESLLVVKNLGVQVTSYFSNNQIRTRFFSSSSVHDLVINEGISLHRIFYYMAIIIKDKDGLKEVFPVFMSSMPRLPVLREIYTDVQTVLHDLQDLGHMKFIDC